MYKVEKVMKYVEKADEALSMICDHGNYFIGEEADVPSFVEKAMSLLRRGSERVAMKYVLAAGYIAGDKSSLMYIKGTEGDALDLLVHSDELKLKVLAHDTFDGCYYVGKEYTVSL